MKIIEIRALLHRINKNGPSAIIIRGSVITQEAHLEIIDLKIAMFGKDELS